MDIETLAVIVTGIPIFGAVIVTAWRAGADRQRTLTAVKALDTRLARCERIIDTELQLNGGSSLKDYVSAVLTRLDDIAEKVNRNDTTTD